MRFQVSSFEPESERPHRVADEICFLILSGQKYEESTEQLSNVRLMNPAQDRAPRAHYLHRNSFQTIPFATAGKVTCTTSIVARSGSMDSASNDEDADADTICVRTFRVSRLLAHDSVLRLRRAIDYRKRASRHGSKS